MRERSGKRSISALAALLLLGVFAVGILSVLLSGAGAYQRLTERDRLAYDSRTCLQYLASKVRQAPGPGAVSLADFGGSCCLVIAEEIGGEAYRTRIYCHEGWLMELFAAADGDFAPEDGEKILQARRLDLTREGDLLRLEITDGNGRDAAILLSLRGGEGAAP